MKQQFAIRFNFKVRVLNLELLYFFFQIMRDLKSVNPAKPLDEMYSRLEAHVLSVAKSAESSLLIHGLLMRFEQASDYDQALELTSNELFIRSMIKFSGLIRHTNVITRVTPNTWHSNCFW